MDIRRSKTRPLVLGIVRILDVLASPLLALALMVGRLFRAMGTNRTPVARRLYDAVGVMPVQDHFYEPLVVPDRPLRAALDRPQNLPGIDLRIDEQLRLLSELRYEDELLRIPVDPTDDLRPYYDNGYFGFGDAEILYSLIRKRRPRTVIEIGSGFSTRFVVAATERNREDERGADSQIVAIEPYANPWLEQLPIQVVRRRVEELDPAFFDRLEEGDILFVDSSHVARPGGDVTFEFLQVIPRLRSGVAVHVHDIRTPRDYPPEWVFERRRLWDEQYLLECLLTHTERFRVMLALNHLHHEYPAELAAACPAYGRATGAGPVSFWFDVI